MLYHISSQQAQTKDDASGCAKILLAVCEGAWKHQPASMREQKIWYFCQFCWAKEQQIIWQTKASIKD